MTIDAEIFCTSTDEFGDRHVDSCAWCRGSGISGLHVMPGPGFFFWGRGIGPRPFFRKFHNLNFSEPQP